VSQELPSNGQADRSVLQPDGSVRFRDGRNGKVQQVSRHGLLWIRDANGNLTSADPKTGWSGDGNWANDISPNQ
jgi:hypothetical protein